MSNLSTKYRTGTKVQHQLFTANGTWTKPAKFIEGTLIVTGIGGGASGNKAPTAIGGNGGEVVVDCHVNVTAISSAAVTIGTGGAAVTGTSPLAGNSGSPTTFGALLTLSGGVAPTTVLRGVSVGGSLGGLDVGGALGSYAMPVPIHCQYAGAVGCRLGGDLVATSNAVNSTIGNAGGGNGLILDGTGVSGGTSLNTSGGTGYGAGGGANVETNSGAGAAGALYLTWQEYI